MELAPRLCQGPRQVSKPDAVAQPQVSATSLQRPELALPAEPDASRAPPNEKVVILAACQAITSTPPSA